MVRVQILLEFMTCLEKLLYNAFEGTAQTIVTPPKVGLGLLHRAMGWHGLI